MSFLYSASDLGENAIGMFTVNLRLELPTRTLTDSLQATSPRHVDLIRQTARANAPAGSYQEITVTRNW